MCILFINANSSNSDSDYCLVLASNRDEYYDRPACSAAPWIEDQHIIGGRDMEKGREGGTWLALSPVRAKIGVLLNLTGNPKTNPKGRGNIVADYVKSTISTNEYVKYLQPFANEYNDFTFVTIEIGSDKSTVQTYNNTTNTVTKWDDTYLGFSNSLPDKPYKKVENGKEKFAAICQKWNKVESKQNLIDELTFFLKWDQKHLPDLELQKRCPNFFEHLGSIFVCMPKGRYGTRTHTIILVTKTGHVDFIEMTLQPPIDPVHPNWKKTEFKFDV